MSHYGVSETITERAARREAEHRELVAERDRLTREVERLREAETHLWALVVWFGASYTNPYVDRDVAMAAGYVNENLSGEDMTARHRALTAAREALREATQASE